ncbi:MAG: hypothetical protein U0165_02840 [Polyangiaceae bacterium]
MTTSSLSSVLSFTTCRVRGALVWVALGFASLLTTGCTQSLDEAVMSQAPTDLECTESEISIHQRGVLGASLASDATTPTTVVVSANGCGREATYACSHYNSDFGDSYSCCNMASQSCWAQ